jgi:hypothetical protein
LSQNLARPLALLIEVKDAETDASDARRLHRRVQPADPQASPAGRDRWAPARAMGIVFARSLVVGRDGAASAVGPFAGYAS